MLIQVASIRETLASSDGSRFYNHNECTNRDMTSISHDERPPPSIADVLAACGAALVEATPAIDFSALYATTNRTATVTDPTVLKTLEEQLPVLGSEFLKRRLAAQHG